MAQKTKTYYTDKVNEQKSMLINCIKRNVKKFGDPYIYVGETSDASFEIEHNRFVDCLREYCLLDQQGATYGYEDLSADQLAILADYSNNI